MTQSDLVMESNQPNKPAAAGTDAADVVGDVKELATKVVDQAKGLIGDQLSGQQERSAGGIGKVANALRQGGEGLADTAAAPYVEKAAAMLDRFEGSVRNANLRDTVRTVEDFARREPVLFLGGAFVVGLLAGRFLKSTAPQTDLESQRMLPAGELPEAASDEDSRGYESYAINDRGATRRGGNRGRNRAH